MNRTIDADALTKRFVEFCNKNCPYTAKARNVMCGSCFMGLALEAVEDAPTIEERKTGKWNFVGNQMFECTSCGVAYTEYQFEKMRVRYNDPKFPRFCPNCGADMRGEKDEPEE